MERRLLAPGGAKLGEIIPAPTKRRATAQRGVPAPRLRISTHFVGSRRQDELTCRIHEQRAKADKVAAMKKEEMAAQGHSTITAFLCRRP